MTPPQLLSEQAFYHALETELGLEPGVCLPALTPWSVGLDSALLIELVLVIEDLGSELSDDLDWTAATFGDLYRAYALDRSTANLGRS